MQALSVIRHLVWSSVPLLRQALPLKNKHLRLPNKRYRLPDALVSTSQHFLPTRQALLSIFQTSAFYLQTCALVRQTSACICQTGALILSTSARVYQARVRFSKEFQDGFVYTTRVGEHLPLNCTPVTTPSNTMPSVWEKGARDSIGLPIWWPYFFYVVSNLFVRNTSQL